MSNIWVVVADASRARIFNAEKPVDSITEIETLSNPEGRLHEGDLVSDRGGRISNGEGARHGYGAGSSVKDEMANRFAATVCKRLEKGRNSRAFERLYVVAAPQFLGLLRKHQSNGVRDLISEEIANELTTQSPERIRAQLPQYL